MTRLLGAAARQPARETADHEAGFVLPYVLMVIAILAIAGTIAAQRLSRASEVISDMQNKMRSERVLHSAEAAASYSLLTGNPRETGYDLSPKSPIVWEFGFLSPNGLSTLREADVKALPQDIWSANGQGRRYDLPGRENPRLRASQPASAFISLQDTAGLVSLNQVNSRMLSSVLQHAGAPKREAETLAQSLWDYVDFDSQKREGGAEASEYKRLKRPAPPNSPLRSFEELGALMHWDEMIGKLDMLKLKELTTVQATTGFRRAFATPTQMRLFNLNSASLLESRRPSFENQLQLGIPKTSGGARLRIWARRADGKYDKRVVEIKRTLGAADVPYRRHWVYDATVLENDLETNLSATGSGNERLELNGLKHVVHAASSAP
jgi:type II secretory pathway pseudopilin PulG